MLSVPLVWHDAGRRRAQRPDHATPRVLATDEIEFLQTIAALLAGIVEKGRLTAEVEARLAAADRPRRGARRAAVASSPTSCGRRCRWSASTWTCSPTRPRADRRRPRTAGRLAATPPRTRSTRLDRLVDSILASVRGEGLTGLSRAPFDAVGAVDETVETLRLLLRPHPIRWDRPDEPLIADRRRGALPPGPRAAPRERVEVRAARRGRQHRRLAGRRRDPGLRHRRRPGRPDRGLGERLRAVRPDRGTRPEPRLRDRAVRRAPADGRDGRPDLPRAERLRRQPLRGRAAGGLGPAPASVA